MFENKYMFSVYFMKRINYIANYTFHVLIEKINYEYLRYCFITCDSRKRSYEDNSPS